MSKFEEHFNRSLEKVKKRDPELYRREKETVDMLLWQLHEWLDYYCGRKGEDEEGEYDFTGIFVIRHRAKRHHLEGINKAVKLFSCLYGDQFANIIRLEAWQHIVDDMGEVLFAEDYQRIGFWRNYGK